MWPGPLGQQYTALLVVSILRSSARPLAWKGTPAVRFSCWAVSVAAEGDKCYPGYLFVYHQPPHMVNGQRNEQK